MGRCALRRNKVVAIIQARMSSSRLPGKVLFPVLDKPLLEHQIKRTKQASLVNEVMIATTVNPADDAIVDFCQHHHILCYRGSEEDVLYRVVRAGIASKARIIVDLTGDCPLVDPVHIQLLVSKLLIEKLDYVSNCFPRSFFDGADIQVYTRDILEKLEKRITNPLHRHHTGWNIYAHAHWLKPKRVKIGHLPAEGSLYRPELRLTLDYKEDYLIIKKIFEHFKDEEYFGVKEIMDYIDANPKLLKINANRKSKIPGQG